ncbi:MAG: GMC family oxidoreductase [Bacteroidota bacterium]|nr:GMC family oxidoreductase [Bacteroidota bacterium]
MHIDARQIDDLSSIEGDICIIGSGAAGISIALEWINTPYKVILLEGGGFEYDERVQELYRGKNTGQNYYPLKSARLHYFGGTTGHWGGMCSTFDPIAFRERDWVPLSGWPFSDQELIPYYKRASDNVSIGEYEFSFNYWQQQDPSLVPLPVSQDIFWNKIWRFGMPSAARFGKKYKDTIVNAKNIHLYTYANAVDIKTNENVSTVTEVTVKNYAGKTHKVRAKYFIIACCSIQTTRLLIASNKNAPAGLGNDNDLVGRYFMEHPELKSAELWLKQPSTLKPYMRNPPNIRAELAMLPQKQAEYKVLNGILSFNPLEQARKKPPYIQTWIDEDPRKNEERTNEIEDKSTRKSRLSKIFGSSSNKYDSFEITMRLEQAPNPLSRVTLDTEKDELGVPRAILHWAFTDMERKSARKIFEILGQQVGIAGIGRVELREDLRDDKDTSMPSTTSGGWHHMGTTRMNNDPKKGVVDSNCKIHGLSNLFIAGSSCFPNGAAVNPTYTIVALSIRLSDHIKETIKNEGDRKLIVT